MLSEWAAEVGFFAAVAAAATFVTVPGTGCLERDALVSSEVVGQCGASCAVPVVSVGVERERE